MKYDADIDPANANTSHVQVLDLVGTGKRVLDVGCSTGYLARAMKERDNVVTGVEVDAAAGEIARSHVVELLIGDLETLDLVEELGAKRFDVIVFADVLEHLTNPLRVLRQTPALLAPGGCVVVSIPNVAHGAVRLALLQGRFEYRDVGLLDDTHVRFFTRTSVVDLMTHAGLTPIDFRRTTADPFATEIPLEMADFPAAVIEKLRADPETTTYQFVIRSVPTTTRSAGDDLGEELVAKDQELEEARSQLRAVSAVVGTGDPPVVGVVMSTGGPDRALDELRAMVIRTELVRRLDGWMIRIFEAGRGQPRPAADATPIWRWGADADPPRAAETLAAAVVTGTWALDAESSPAATGMAEAGLATHLAGLVVADREPWPWPDGLGPRRDPGAVVGWVPSDEARGRRCVVADPLLLADRLFDQLLLRQRVEHLRFAGVLPQKKHILVQVGAYPDPDAESLGRALQELAGETLSIVLVPDRAYDPDAVLATSLAARIDGASFSTDPWDALDLVAAVAGAALVVSDAAGLLWLTLALRRPCIALHDAPGPDLRSFAAWVNDPDVVVSTPASLLAGRAPAERRSANPSPIDNATQELELFIDELAGVLATTPASRLATSLPARLAEARERAMVVEAVNSGLALSLRKQRLAFGDQARKANLGELQVGVSVMEHEALQDRLRRTEENLEAARTELRAAYDTRTMRTLAPARRMYGRLRHLP